MPTHGPLSNAEIEELLSATLHGALPHETMLRVFATLQETIGLRSGRRGAPLVAAALVAEAAAAATFRPGLYRHYKGGLYTALQLVTHHETRRPMVLYVSHTYGGINVRPLLGWEGDSDGWCDLIEKGSELVERFEYVGELPSDVPIEAR